MLKNKLLFVSAIFIIMNFKCFLPSSSKQSKKIIIYVKNNTNKTTILNYDFFDVSKYPEMHTERLLSEVSNTHVYHEVNGKVIIPVDSSLLIPFRKFIFFKKGFPYTTHVIPNRSLDTVIYLDLLLK